MLFKSHQSRLTFLVNQYTSDNMWNLLGMRKNFNELFVIQGVNGKQGSQGSPGAIAARVCLYFDRFNAHLTKDI